MYRIEQLRPLSRQHQLGLSLSRQAMQCPKDSTTDDIFRHWQALVAYVHDDRIAHFAIEEIFGYPFIGKSWQPPQSDGAW